MDIGLANQKVLITGSTAGIGLASAIAFARENARVVVNGRSEERVRAAIDAVKKAVPGAEVQGAVADIASTAGIERIITAHPDLDVLVNNAGVFAPAAFEDIPDAEWMRFFETNVMSGVRLARHYFPRMLQANYGRIIFVSSESAIQIPIEMIHYGVTKTAQLAVARGLAERTHGTNVTVNSVLPGPTGSEGVGEFVRQLATSRGITFEAMEREFFASARPSSLLGRFARPEEIANMIVYLGSARRARRTVQPSASTVAWFAAWCDVVPFRACSRWCSASTRQQPTSSCSRDCAMLRLTTTTRSRICAVSSARWSTECAG